jgi:hypothetical protein
MLENDGKSELEGRIPAAEERLRLAETASGFATFGLDLNTGNWEWSPEATELFGFDPTRAGRSIAKWDTVFVDDKPKIESAIGAAAQTGRFCVEFRVKNSDGSLHWIAGKGHVAEFSVDALRGTFYEITERKALEVRLLALNETLEARVAEVRQEARTLEVLNRTGVAVAAEHDLERLVQMVTEAGVELSHAQFGAFFYNVSKKVASHIRFIRWLAHREKLFRSSLCRGIQRSSSQYFADPHPCGRMTFWPIHDTEGVLRSTECPPGICQFGAISRYRLSPGRGRFSVAYFLVILNPAFSPSARNAS